MCGVPRELLFSQSDYETQPSLENTPNLGMAALQNAQTSDALLANALPQVEDMFQSPDDLVVEHTISGVQQVSISDGKVLPLPYDSHPTLRIEVDGLPVGWTYRIEANNGNSRSVRTADERGVFDFTTGSNAFEHDSTNGDAKTQWTDGGEFVEIATGAMNKHLAKIVAKHSNVRIKPTFNLSRADRVSLLFCRTAKDAKPVENCTLRISNVTYNTVPRGAFKYAL